MKITIVQGAFLPVPTLRGGAVEKIWFGLGKEFSRLGHEVLHVSRLCDNLPAEEIIDGVRHRRIPGFDTPESRWRLKWRDLRYTRRVRSVLPRADIVVTNTFWAPLLFKPKHHGAIWVHVQRYPKGQMKHYRKALRLQTVSGVIARAIAAEAPEFASRVRVIPNPLPTIVPPARPVVKDPNLILFVGRIHPEKGLPMLIEAMTILQRHRPRARLRIVGPWEERFGGGGAEFSLQLRFLATPLGDGIEFVGPVFDEAALSAHYEEAAVFVYPTLAARGEASPVAPLEALAHGLPVVVSDLECFNDYLGEDCFVQRFNHEAASASARLAGVLENILSSPESWPKIAEAARTRAEQFSMERIARRYLEDFQSALAGSVPVRT